MKLPSRRPSWPSRRSTILTALLTSVLPVIGMAQPEGTLAKTERFRAILSPEAYEKAVSQLDQDRLDPAKILANHLPDWGLYIMIVEPDGQAGEAGVQPGWVLSRCEGRELWTRSQDLELEKPTREFVFVTPEGEEKTYHFHQGKAGISYHDFSRQEHVLLHDVPRGPWERDLLAVPQAWTLGLQDLAETALNHARAKGMPESPYSDYYAALLALDRGDLETAELLKEAVLLATSASGGTPHYFREGMRCLALAENDVALLEKCSAELEGLTDRMMIPADVTYWKDHGFGRTKNSLLPYALAHAGEDAIPAAQPIKDTLGSRYSMFTPRNIGHNYGCSAPDHHYDGLAFTGPVPMHDLIWEVTGIYGDTPEKDGHHTVDFGLVDLKARTEKAETGVWGTDNHYVGSVCSVMEAAPYRALYFTGGLDGGLIENHRNLPRLTPEETARLSEHLAHHVEIKPSDFTHIFNLKFIRIGNELEVLMNDSPVLHVPIQEEIGDLGCQMQFSGCEAYIFSSTLRPIDASEFGKTH